MTTLELLRLVPMLRSLAVPQLMAISAHASTERLKAHAPYLAAYLQPAPAAYLVEGSATTHPALDGRELTLPLFPGEWAKLEQLFTPHGGKRPTPPTERLEAHSEVLLVHIPMPLMLEAAQGNPEFAMRLAQAHTRQARRHRELLATALHASVPDRLLYLLRLLALHRFHSPSFTFPYDQQTAAAMLGCSRESLSRALTTLRREGKIRTDKHHVELR